MGEYTKELRERLLKFITPYIDDEWHGSGWPTTAECIVDDVILGDPLISSAVNSCISINPSNPQAVAEGMGELKKMLKQAADFLYGYSESSKRVPAGKPYQQFKALYIKIYDFLAKIEGGK